MNMGDKIKQRRTELKMTQEDLAEKLNVSRSSVANWEAGRNYPDLQLIAAIADILGLSLDELLREDCEMIKRIAEDTKCRKKQSWKIRVLSTFLAVALIATSIIGVKYLPTNMEVEAARIHKAAVEVEMGYNLFRTEPAPAKEKAYGYNDYNLALHFIHMYNVQFGLEFQTAISAREDCANAWFAEEIVPETAKPVAGLETYRINCSWDTDDDGKMDTYAVVTGIDAGYGLYIIDTYGVKKESLASVKKKHNKIVRSFELTDSLDYSGTPEGIGQVGDFVFSLAGWDTNVINYESGMVIYQSQRDLAYLLDAKPIDEVELTDENLVKIMKEFHMGSLNSVKLVAQSDPVKTKVGSAIIADFHTSYSGGSGERSMLFVLNKDDKIAACFTKVYDDDMTGEYERIINSIDYREKYEKQIAGLWDSRVTELVGHEAHGEVLELVTNVGFGEYGNYYSTEFTADNGIRIIYDEPIAKQDFTRECTLLLILVQPLEYVEVVYSVDESQILREEDAFVDGYGRPDKIGQDEELFTMYYWDTLEK